MSYFPKSGRAAAALKDLTIPIPDGAPWYANLSRMYPEVDLEALRELLIATICPIVCDGVVRGEKWHQLCEDKADAALRAMGHG